MDLVEWDLIQEQEVGLYWVMESHALGWDPLARTVRHRELVALYGPYAPSQAHELREGTADYLAWPVPRYEGLDAAERRPADYAVVAHLGDDLLELAHRMEEGGGTDA